MAKHLVVTGTYWVSKIGDWYWTGDDWVEDRALAYRYATAREAFAARAMGGERVMRVTSWRRGR